VIAIFHVVEVCTFTLSVIFKPCQVHRGEETRHFMPVRSDDPQPLLHLDGVLLADEVQVWHVQLQAWEKSADELFEFLNTDERERASRFKFPAPRNQFVISRSLLRRTLGRYLQIDARDVRFGSTGNGKPELDGNPGLQFNLSHTEGVTAFAIARNRRVGIDVEKIRENTEALNLATRFFSHREVEWLRSQPVSEHVASFFDCWTAKEAYIKAHGQGLSMPLGGFSVLPGLRNFRLELQVDDDPRESGHWSMWRLDLGAGFRAALAVEGDGARIRVGALPPEAEF
jgi:4'-phosphopantetheinyl transferase